jgi:DNA mismatch repair protein MutS
MQATITPLMKQYRDIKVRFPDTLVLFQVGDFYELFFDDAKTTSAFLGITLTKRGKSNGEPIPLCGVPVHALDHYLNKLIRGGFKVALCDQLEPACPGKVVDRGVTRVFTPGTLTESALLDEKKASYLFSFFPLAQSWGLLFGELLTAQLFATVLPSHGQRVVESELIRFFPDEVLLPATKVGKEFQSYFKQLGYFTSLVDFNQADEAQAGAATAWVQQFKSDARSIIDTHEAVRMALYHFYAYLRTTQESSLTQFNQLQLYKADDYLILDQATQRNLELVNNNHDGGRANTLFCALDGAVTAMGSRMIRKWVLRPLVKQEAIMQRHDVVQAFVADVAFMHRLKEVLAIIGDAERVIGRIALRRGQLTDYGVLTQIVGMVPFLKALLVAKAQIPLIATVIEQCANFSELYDLLVRSLNDDATKDWIIKTGFDQKLDHIRGLVDSGNQKMMDLEEREKQATGIGSLKIRYNAVHGYAIEITKTHYDSVPAHYVRRQTLVGRERFTTAELQELEHEIAQARADIVSVEQALFEAVKRSVHTQVVPLRKMAHALAHLDALLGMAMSAYMYGYVRPTMSMQRDMIIVQGRHPVVERSLQGSFIPNDTVLTDEQSLWIITGPNMGGKSTYLRQVALLAIMAQCGSFIPAQRAQLPILDRVFTRIGSGDNLVGGKSTFMVEMEETASICSQATENSLVILDEVGRGTSTFDGLAIAQAVVEHIYTVLGARCLFATHYHELTQLEVQFPGIVSYYAASSKTSTGIVFLYKMIRGVADGSFGVEVARLAALPGPVIARAEQILQELTSHEREVLKVMPALRAEGSDREALCLLQSELQEKDALLAALRAIDYDNLSPKQAFDLLWQIRARLGR